MAPPATATTDEGNKPERRPWQTATKTKLATCIEGGVSSSTKSHTRQWRVNFYMEELARAKTEVAFYSAMLELEDGKEKNGSSTLAKPVGEGSTTKEAEDKLEQMTLSSTDKDEDTTVVIVTTEH